jgi:predicted ATPase
MTVERIWVRGYRSLVDLSIDLGRITVVQGENASGKTNIYRSLLILARGAAGRMAATVLTEGGMPSMQWAGAAPTGRGKRRQPVRVTFGAEVDGLSYELDLGLPNQMPDIQINPFFLDAEIKEEQAWIGARSRHTLILDRSGIAASARAVDGSTVTLPLVIDPAETALSQLGDPTDLPELFALRRRLSGWRFYHHFPTDTGASSRQPRTGVRTPVLSDDGHDLAAALLTIRDAGRGDLLDSLLDQAFPGTQLQISGDRGVFTMSLALPGLPAGRPLSAGELSDGTLRYLCLLAALLSPQPPELLVLNEPETSLHPDLLAPLATLIAAASLDTQVLVTTHAAPLAEVLVERDGAHLVRLQRDERGWTTTVP